MKKCGKEIEAHIDPSYTVNFGTVNNKDPKAVYINISAWGKPKTNQELNYERVISKLKRRVHYKLDDTLKNINDRFYDNISIVDFDMRSSGVKYNRKSYLGCEITLYQRNKRPITSEELPKELSEISSLVINDVLNQNEFFTFTRKK